VSLLQLAAVPLALPMVSLWLDMEQIAQLDKITGLSRTLGQLPGEYKAS